MSAFTHVAHIVICNGVYEDGRACMGVGNSDNLDLMDGTTARVRKILKAEGWTVNVPNPDPDDPTRRLDFCPDHKPEGS